MVVALHWVDITIIVCALIAIFVVLFIAWKKKAGDTAKDFFLSGRNMEWWVVGASLFASNIGSEHFVGQAGAAAANGIAVGLYEWTAIFLLLSLGWVFVPVYLRTELTTVPEWFEKRFSKWTRLVLSIMTIIAYVITKISNCIYSGAIFLEVLLGWNIYLGVGVIVVFTGVYTLIGGLTIVMYTDVMQLIVFLVGGMFGMSFAMKAIGGFPGMLSVVSEANMTGYLDTIRPLNAANFSPIGMFVGQMIASLWYWCIDQEMVQRVFSARTPRHAKGGTLLAGFLKILPVFVILFPGMAARALYETCHLHPDSNLTDPQWCHTNLSDPEQSNKAYPYLIIYEFPIGVVGLISSSLLAAMMSSLSAVFNSASTIFTVDIYTRFFRPSASDRETVLVGRLSTVLMTLLGLAWIPVIQSQRGQIYLITQNTMTHISPTLTTVFLLGIFWHRMNGHGALVGMIVGLILGFTRLISFFVLSNRCSLEGVYWLVCGDFNFFAIFLSIIVAIVVIAVSLLTEAPKKSDVRQHVFVYPSWCCSYCQMDQQEIEPEEKENGHQKDHSGDSDDEQKLVDLDPEHETTQEPPTYGTDESDDQPLQLEADQQLNEKDVSETSAVALQLEPYSDTILNALAIILFMTTVGLITGFSGIFY